MQSEALRNIRTMRQVKTGLDLSRHNRSRTTNSLSKIQSEVDSLASLTDRRLHQVLQKERKRFATQQASVAKSRERVLKSREKLAITVNRNRALTGLRRELQKSCWEAADAAPPKTILPPAKQDMPQIELRY